MGLSDTGTAAFVTMPLADYGYAKRCLFLDDVRRLGLLRDLAPAMGERASVGVYTGRQWPLGC